MGDFSNYVRTLRPLTNYETKVIGFMADRGHTSYERDILNLSDMFSETVAEAGPGGSHCEETQRRLDAIETDYNETIQSAVDRYEDWASDPLP